ncbi:MAG: diaminopimelate epimerase [Eubacteriales bacterium]|nr:diaminopimelate epimerase [Eubacteriales bacterium]MDN5363096.1 diaminopimelate epimerase [Eubacteriales bacterium]
MQFTKVHGLGNDFVLVDCTRQPHLPVDRDDLLAEAARRICHRHFGVGADGLVLILPSEKAHLRMRIFNPDGSEPEMCGNAIRCFARYAYEKGLVKEEEITVETLAGIIRPRVVVQDGKVTGVRVDMGEPRLERHLIPMNGPPGRVVNEVLEVEDRSYRVTAVSMGNPHCVIFTDDASAVSLAEVGPLIENHPAFPARTNVEFVQVVNSQEIIMRVWERGAGETLACGTGACASAVAAVLNGYTGRRVTVHLAGGDLLIEWEDNNHVYMTGQAEFVFTGELLIEPY